MNAINVMNVINASNAMSATNAMNAMNAFKNQIKSTEDAIKLLLSKGGDCNLQDNDGRTHLMFAALFGCMDLAKLLLSKGADCNLQDNDGQTALMYAETKQNQGVRS